MFSYLLLVIRDSSLRELKDDGTARKSPVDLGIRVEPVVNSAALLLVENDLEDLGVVLLGAKTLANYFNRVDEIGQNGIMNSS